MDSVGGTFGERRGEFDLTLEILRLASRGEGRTRIMYAANLSHAMLKRYLDGLLTHGFVERRGEVYVLTPKGAALKLDMERVHMHFRVEAPEAHAIVRL